MKPLPFFADPSQKITSNNAIIALPEEQLKRPRAIKDYLAQISNDVENSANIMIDISELHDHFLLDPDEKNQDPATRFPSLAKQFKENHDIEFIHKNAIKIEHQSLMGLVYMIREHRLKTAKFNGRLNVFLLAHGGPAWFFGPTQDFFKEKIGMVWVENDQMLGNPFFKHSHFVLSPTQLYFFPKNATVAINCRLPATDVSKVQEIFNKNALKPYFEYQDVFKVKAMSRAELRAMSDFVCFDIELNDDDKVAWIEFNRFSIRMDPILSKKHFVISKSELFFYDGADYTKLPHVNIEALKQLFPQDKNNPSNPKLPYIRFQILAKEYIAEIKKHLGLTGITWSKVAFREVDFIWGERAGTRFISNLFQDISRMTGTRIEHVCLHSCFSAAEFYNEKTGNYLLSSARLFSTLFKETYVTGCVGLNADAKATKLYNLADIKDESELLAPSGFNLTDSLVTYQKGLVLQKPGIDFAIKTGGPYLNNLQDILFKEDIRPYLKLYHLDEVIKTIEESHQTFFGYQQARLYPKFNA